jgi:hypothetical protein
MPADEALDVLTSRSVDPMPADEALDVLAALVNDDDRRWGEVATDHQRADAAAILDLAGPRRHFVTRPRGGSKTTDLGGIAIAALLVQLPRMSRSYAFASDKEQAQLLIDTVAGFKDRTPGLGSLLVGANRVTNANTGATLQVMASDDASAWGLRPHLTITDEIGQWPSHRRVQRLWSAIVSALPKVEGSRLVALTSAGDPAHWSHKVLERARSADGWRASEMPGPTPWTAESELVELRRDLSEWEYRRLVLNEWTAADDRLTSAEDLRRCVTLEGSLAPAWGVRYVIGLDLGVKDDRTVLSVCHAEPVVKPGQRPGQVAGVRVVLDRQQVWEGSRRNPVRLDEVEAAVWEVSRSFNRAKVVCDPWQAMGMAQRLRERGVVVTEFAFSQQSVGRLAMSLYQLLRDGMLALPPDEALIDELAHVRLEERAPGVVRMEHDSGRHDDRAISLALAAHQLLADPPRAVGMTKAVDRRFRGRR